MTAQSAAHAPDSVRANEAFSVPSIAALTHSVFKPFAQADVWSKSSLFLGILVAGLLLSHRGTAAAEDASSLTRHAVDALSQKRYDTALQAALAADAILEKDTAPNPRERVAVKLLIGEALLAKNRPIEAEKLARESKAILDTTSATGLDGVRKLIDIYNLLARSLAQQGKHTEVYILASEVAEGVKKKNEVLSVFPWAVDGILQEGAKAARELKDFQFAITLDQISIDLYGRAIKTWAENEELRSSAASTLLLARYTLGDDRIRAGQSSIATTEFAQLATDATQQGFRPFADRCFIRLGEALVYDGQLEQAIQVLSDATGRLNEFPVDKELGLSLLANAYCFLERFDDAKIVMEKMLQASIKAGNFKRAVESMRRLGNAFLHSGSLVQARESLELALNALGSHAVGADEEFFYIFADLAEVYTGLGNLPKASRMLEQAWNALPRAAVEYSVIKSNLVVSSMCGIEASYWSMAGRSVKQLEMALRSYSIARQFAVNDPLTMAKRNLSLGQAYFNFANYKSAVQHFVAAQDDVRKQRNPNFAESIRILDWLATVASEQGEGARALAYRTELLELAANKFGKNNPLYWENLGMLGIQLTRAGFFERASAVCVEVQLLCNEHAWREMVFLPIGEYYGFAGLSLIPQIACVAALATTNAVAHRHAAYASILAKSLHTEVCSVQAKMGPRQSVVEARGKLRQFWSGAGGSNSFQLATSAYLQRDKIAVGIMAALEASKIPFVAVEKALPEDSVLLDFQVSASLESNAAEISFGTKHYAAILTFPPSKNAAASTVVIVDLGQSALVNAAVIELHELFAKKLIAPKRLEPVLQRLGALLYAPLAPYLTNVAHLIICPDGQLGRLPFELLQIDVKGRFLVEDKLITYVSSGREIARLAQTRPTVPTSAPLVMGNPDFNLDFARSGRSEEAPSKLASRSLELGTNSQTFITATAPNRMRSRDISSPALKFNPLPGSELEARSVAALLGKDTTVRLGAAARESELKAVVSPSVLHLATHGFFLTDQEFKGTNSFREPWRLAGEFTPYPRAPEQDWENPLIRCGIALAGANHAASITNALAEDGLLTGLEASLLNLQGTKLVILSACDTGSGDVKIGEGVMSLRRAFTIAGAETVLASHWKVNDEATSLLMTEFMRRWQAGEPRGTAWREAQLSLLRSKDFSNPYFWAAFTLTGQWR